jgi:acetylornithine/succinyldiaminopimelate/putrescine aminotransferase
VALEYFAVLEEENLLQNAARVGEYFNEQLNEVAAKSSLVRGVRGRGLMQAVELSVPARPLVEQGLAEGVLFNSTHDTVLRFLPSFLFQEKHVDRGIRVLRKLLREAKRRRNRRRAAVEKEAVSPQPSAFKMDYGGDVTCYDSSEP